MTVALQLASAAGESSPILAALLLALLIALSGAFSGSETVLFSLTRSQLEQASRSRNPFRRAAWRLMRSPKRTLTTILLGNTAVNVLLYAVTYVLFEGLASRFGAWITPVAAALSVLLVVVFGEVTPKVLAVTLPNRLAPFSAAIVQTIGYVLGPLGRLLDVVMIEPLTRVLFGSGGRRTARSGALSTAEFKALLELSRRRGALDRPEDLYLRDLIDVGHTRVREIMTPRVEMAAFETHTPPDEVRARMRHDRITKAPVFEGSVDNILGLIYAKVLFFETDRPLRQLLTPASFVPELITVDRLLERFRDTRSQVAIAVDEYGGVAGMVTLDDALGEIFGAALRPDQPDEPDLERRSATEYEIGGQLSLRYWSEVFGPVSQSPRLATVGGLVTKLLGRPARLGDVVRLGNVELRVTALRRRRIDRLSVRLIPPDETAPAGGAA